MGALKVASNEGTKTPVPFGSGLKFGTLVKPIDFCSSSHVDSRTGPLSDWSNLRRKYLSRCPHLLNLKQTHEFHCFIEFTQYQV